MSFNFENLDHQTRGFMVDEIEIDIAESKIYFSAYLSQVGQDRWIELLLEAAKVGNADTLATIIRNLGLLNVYYTKQTTGVRASVPSNGHIVLAESEFNRYYIRAVCRKAIATGVNEVEAYRARSSENPRRTSEVLIGQMFSAPSLLNDVRNATKANEFFTHFGVPVGPGSGISVRLPRATRR